MSPGEASDFKGQESHGYYGSRRLKVEVKEPEGDPEQARREQVIVQAIGEQTLIYVKRMHGAERFEALNYMRCCGRPWKLSGDLRE